MIANLIGGALMVVGSIIGFFLTKSYYNLFWEIPLLLLGIVIIYSSLKPRSCYN